MTLVPVAAPGLGMQRHQIQPGVPTRGSDCGPTGVLVIIDDVSAGKVRVAPSLPEAIAQIRRWMGKPAGATTVADAVRALTHPELRRLFAAVGLRPPKVTPRRGATWGRLEDDLEHGADVYLLINYGVHRKAGGPVYSRTFSGGHVVVARGRDDTKPPLVTNIADSLDTRWRRLRFDRYMSAAGLFGERPHGIGKAEAMSVQRAKPIAADDGAEKLRRLRRSVMDVAGALENVASDLDKAVEAAA